MQVQRMSAQDHVDMSSSVRAAVDSMGAEFDYGTLWSGDEVTSQILSRVFLFLQSQFGVVFAPSLKYVCEINETRRQFIIDHAHPVQAFSDGLALSNNKWVGTNCVTSAEGVPMVRTRFLFAGFECDS
eukprot:1906024-Pyramimonas_sp.AAC.1